MLTIFICDLGMMTSQGTLMGIILILLHYPDVQRKLQAECDKILARGRHPTLADRKDMPYTQATLTEALRFLTTLPIAVPHMAAENTTVGGYDIPAGTIAKYTS